MKGADIKQIVNDRNLGCCGTILWECKNTANWNNSWVQKLKEDQRQSKADIAVLASAVLPENIKSFGMSENVWITSFSVVSCLSEVLRYSLIEVAANRSALVNKDQKIEALYSYFASSGFRQRIEPIVEALSSMQVQISRERRAMESHWAEREEGIRIAIKGAAGLYGDIKGIMGGAAVSQIESLQLLSAPKE